MIVNEVYLNLIGGKIIRITFLKKSLAKLKLLQRKTWSSEQLFLRFEVAVLL